MKIIVDTLEFLTELLMQNIPFKVSTLADQHKRKDRGNDGAGGGSGGSGDAGVSTGGAGLTAV